jgi:cyclopropane-fatty-acyl-phospholipid synthase
MGIALAGRLRGGHLTVEERGQRREFGPADADLAARVAIRDPRAWWLLTHGSLGLGQGYVDGYWDTDDLVTLVRVLARNVAPFDRWRRWALPVLRPIRRATGGLRRNTRAGARLNVAAHYDLGNELFEAFLDRELIYSCAYFGAGEEDLDEAQRAKLDRVCERLRLGPDDHLVEIGTGWGGLAIHAAREYGCRVTTTTISREQGSYARQRVQDLGLDDRVTVRGADYRDLSGRFDKLVSVEMIEAVGWQYFETFFRKCSALLKDDGLMFLQAIVIDDAHYEAEKTAKSFANTVIFPGGCLPSERVIRDLIASETDMTPVWVDDITAHYPPTLRSWRERFNAAVPTLRPLGYDERFQRTWNFYLASSEAGFLERRIGDLQMLFAKPGATAEDSVVEQEPAFA